MATFSIEFKKGSTFQPLRGAQGFSFNSAKKQYMQPVIGAKGFSFERPTVGGMQKILHYRAFRTAGAIKCTLIPDVSNSVQLTLMFRLRDDNGTGRVDYTGQLSVTVKYTRSTVLQTDNITVPVTLNRTAVWAYKVGFLADPGTQLTLTINGFTPDSIEPYTLNFPTTSTFNL